MPVAIGAERWKALEELARFELPTRSRLATLMGISRITLALETAKRGLELPDFRRRDIAEAYRQGGRHVLELMKREPGERDAAEEAVEPAPAIAGSPILPASDPDAPTRDRAERIASLLLRSGDLLIARAEAQGGVLTSQQINTVSAMLRLAEKLEMQAERSAAEKQIRSDAEAAAIFERVDGRIVELGLPFAVEVIAQLCADGKISIVDPDWQASLLGGRQLHG